MDFIPNWHTECTTERFHQGFITKFKGQIGPSLAPNGQYFEYFEPRGLWNPLNVHEIIDTDQITPNYFKITHNGCTQDLELGQKWSKMSKIAKKLAKMTLKSSLFQHTRTYMSYFGMFLVYIHKGNCNVSISLISQRVGQK